MTARKKAKKKAKKKVAKKRAKKKVAKKKAKKKVAKKKAKKKVAKKKVAKKKSSSTKRKKGKGDSEAAVYQEPREGEERELLGILTEGLSATSLMSKRAWSLTVRMRPWRFEGGALERKELAVGREVGASAGRDWRREVAKGDVVRCTVRWETPGSDDPWNEFPSEPARWVLVGKPTRDRGDEELSRIAAKARAPKRIEVEPFPPLVWDEYAWTGSAELEAGLGGEVALVVSADGPKTKPLKAQKAAYEQLAQRLDEGEGRILQAVLAYAKAFVAEMWPKGERKPRLSKPKDVRSKIELGAVHLHDQRRGGEAYVGLEFECAWDAEHGLGVVLHKKRVVAVGAAQVALGEFED